MFTAAQIFASTTAEGIDLPDLYLEIAEGFTFAIEASRRPDRSLLSTTSLNFSESKVMPSKSFITAAFYQKYRARQLPVNDKIHRIQPESEYTLSYRTMEWTLGKWVFENRKLRLKWSQEVLAEKIGVSKSYISKIENSSPESRTEVSRKVLDGLAAAFGVPASEAYQAAAYVPESEKAKPEWIEHFTYFENQIEDQSRKERLKFLQSTLLDAAEKIWREEQEEKRRQELKTSE